MKTCKHKWELFKETVAKDTEIKKTTKEYRDHGDTNTEIEITNKTSVIELLLICSRCGLIHQTKMTGEEVK